MGAVFVIPVHGADSVQLLNAEDLTKKKGKTKLIYGI